jgi:DNA-binding transcriptional LysR family regulator
MDIADLETFLVVASANSLQAATKSLHQTPSALSKAIKRLEAALNTTLFDRIGRGLELNAAGERLRTRAMVLVQMANETRSEFLGTQTRLHCRVAAPAMLHWRFGAMLAGLLTKHYADSAIAFLPMYEDAALLSLAHGEAEFALVSGAAIVGALPPHIEAIALGEMSMQLAAGSTHPLARGAKRRASASTAQVLQHDFACPQRSLFCGVDRGSQADGWRNDKLPRRIRYWPEDLQVLISLVRSGLALAYLPDFALSEPGLIRINVIDCPYQCIEKMYLLWRPSAAHGWQRRLAQLLPIALGVADKDRR